MAPLFSKTTLVWSYVATTLADRVILILAVVFIVWLYLHYWNSDSQPAHYALILTAHQPPQQIDLQKTQQIVIQGHLGPSVIEIAAGRIRFKSSPCQKQFCVHAGWLETGGHLVSCLPNQVSIALYSAEKLQFDAIAY